MTRTSMKLVVVSLSVAAVAVLFFAAGGHSLFRRQDPIVSQYVAQGLQMVEGCNGGAAVTADGQVFEIQQRLEEFGYSPHPDTNKVAQLQRVLVIAQEKARILREDCRNRGHRETHPWKTNWATIKQALTASEVYQWSLGK